MITKRTLLLLDYDFIASTNNGFLNIKCLRDGTVLRETSEHIKDGILPYKPRFLLDMKVKYVDIDSAEDALYIRLK